MACTGEKGKPTKPCCPHTKRGGFRSRTRMKNSSNRKESEKEDIRLRLIPKDRAAWMNFLVELAKKKMKIKYLTDDEVRTSIERTRPHLFRQKLEPLPDPDLPLCFPWTQEQVGEWIELIGFPQYKEAFLLNNITGRRLINMDASALNKIGLRWFDDIKTIAVKIRELLDTWRPNILRAIMRRVPFELYLKQRRFTGEHYDHMTFESWCEENGYPYRNVLEFNKCALIECICQVLLILSGDPDEEFGSDVSINEAPSVEFTVRHIVVRNRMVDEILRSMMGCAFSDPAKRTCLKPLPKRLSEIICSGLEELGISEGTCRERTRFVRSIADELMVEVRRTAEVMKDLHEFKKQLQLGSAVISDQDMIQLKELSEEFLDETSAIAVLLTTGQLELENIFKQDPELSGFVDEIVEEAEAKINAHGLDPTENFVDELICEAKNKILRQNFPTMNFNWIKATKNQACGYIDQVFSGNCDPAHLSSCPVRVKVDYIPEPF